MPAPDPQVETGLAARISRWAQQRPVAVVILVSLLAVLINCYPVIFCGKSFVSPASATGAMVYDAWPTLPGMPPIPHVYQHGSDTGSILGWGIPVGFIESRSVLDYGEIPLWNRYGHAGYTLIGQAISMFGDPLQLIVIFGHGSAAAWDVKFLVAKFIFCVGLGLLIRRLFGDGLLPPAFAALGAWCGAWSFIDNHPVFFVFTYAPWILLAGLNWMTPGSRRHGIWVPMWLLANFACFNAGHVEVAVLLIGGLNLAAVAHALGGCRTGIDAGKILLPVVAGTALFLGLTAPMWMSFLATLDGAYSAHASVVVKQLPFVSLPGVFDDLFFLLPLKNDSFAAPAPGTSLLVAVGALLTIARWRHLKSDRFFWINSGAIVVWAGCVFGWVPHTVLAAVPLLNRVGHLYTDFSYLLVIHLLLQCAYGFKSLAAAPGLRRGVIDLSIAGSILAAIVTLYCLGLGHRPIPQVYFSCATAAAFGAPLLFLILKNRQAVIPAAGWIAIGVIAFIPHYRFGLYTFGDEKWMMLPGPRVTLNAPSPAIERIKTEDSEPFRTIGVGWNLVSDYSAVYGLEDIRSCAPLSSMELVDLIRNFPGMQLTHDWIIEVKDPVRAQPLLNLLNVKHVLTPPSVTLEPGLDYHVSDRSDFGVLENLEVWPRAFFTDKIIATPSTEAFIDTLSQNPKQPFIALAPDEIAQHPEFAALEHTANPVAKRAARYQLRPNSTAFDIQAPSAGMVCLTEGQAKDFSATANGQPARVLTVNRTFKGIYLDRAGDYHVTFTYRPRYWKWSCALFWAAVAGTAAWMVIAFFRDRKDMKQSLRSSVRQ